MVAVSVMLSVRVVLVLRPRLGAVSEPASMAGLLDPCPAPLLALAPSGVVTATSTVVPSVPAGAVAVIWMSLSTAKPVAGVAQSRPHTPR